MTFLELCRKLIGFDTTPEQSTLAAAEFLADLAERSGLRAEIQKENHRGLEQANVLIRHRDFPNPSKEELLLLTHLDTVDPGNFSLWRKTQNNPFNASLYGDELFGLGAADAKLDLACKFEAARRIADAKDVRPFVVAATYGAQSGMDGVIKLYRRKKTLAKQALIGEPTDRSLFLAGQGFAALEIFVPFSEEEKNYRADHDMMESTTTQSRIFTGKAAHSLVPESGDNAIIKMLEYLSQLPKGIAIMDLDGGVNHNSVPESAVLEVDFIAGFKQPLTLRLTQIFEVLKEMRIKLAEFSDENYEPSTASFNLGIIRTSEEGVRLQGCCRLPPSFKEEIYNQWVQRIQDVCEKTEASFHVLDYKKGYTTGLNSDLAQRAIGILKQLGVTDTSSKKTIATEGNILNRLGVECLVWGPGISVGNSYAPNESVKMSDLLMAVDFYERFIKR